jgi:hypothetical protein
MENNPKTKEITFLSAGEYAKLSQKEKDERMKILTETLKKLKETQK